MGATFAALRHRNYRIWAGADFVSVIGTWMQVLGINWYVLQESGSATFMGFTVLLQTIPALLLSLWGGALADRLPARPLLITTQLAHGALAAALAAIAWSDIGGLPLVYVISLVGGAVSAVEGPVMGRWCATLVDRETLGNALALGSLINSTARILGMSAGAVLVAAVGIPMLFAVNSISFVAVVFALLAVRERERFTLGSSAVAPESRTALDAIRAGFSYLRRQPVILTVLALAVVLGSLGRNYQVTMAAMSDGPLHSGASGYGFLSTVFAVGTVVGALVAARHRELGYRTLIAAGLIASSLQLTAGLAPDTWSFAAVILPIAAAAVVIDTTVSTRVQLDTDGAMRGRVLAALGVTSAVSGAVGAPLLGWLSEVAGPRQTLVLAGFIAASASGLAGIGLARLRGRRVRLPVARPTSIIRRARAPLRRREWADRHPRPARPATGATPGHVVDARPGRRSLQLRRRDAGQSTVPAREQSG